MIDAKTLGRRIKYFRKRAGMSQMELELAMNASAGMISRIESGKVNPSKESVRKVAEILNMNPNELDYLIGVTAVPSTKEEIEEVYQQLKYYLDKSSVFGYLTDERWRILHVSKGFQKILNADQKTIDGVFGKTIIQILLDERLGVKGLFDESAYDEMVRIQLAYCKREISFMKDDKIYQVSIEEIEKHPKIFEYWNSLDTEKLGVFYEKDERIVPFKVGPVKFKMMYARERLLDNPRFEIVEYIPVNKYFRTVQNLLKGRK
ncbi:helix-turn-helix domain-containing protein [Candidatus Dojkabacteria bacterium]|nr:helix-turn-helix domain-containing protein [Candidatus Dojkabacteria bacterium]